MRGNGPTLIIAFLIDNKSQFKNGMILGGIPFDQNVNIIQKFSRYLSVSGLLSFRMKFAA